MKRGKFNIIMGAQAGSESKGKLGMYLAEKFTPDVICIAASPNSGHTGVIDGKKYITYHLPVSWKGNEDAVVCLGPTSVINLDILLKEAETLGIPWDKIVIHPRAVMIRPHYLHVEREEGLLKIGSTNQGVGVARREKLMRVGDITYAGDVPVLQECIGDTVHYINGVLNRGHTILCEMTQGFDLCLEHGIDPMYATSKMVNPAMAMAEAGVSPQFLGDVYGVLRPYPIRVNNRDGSSGPYAEAREITWEEVATRCGHPRPKEIGELTTTTKLPRRVFEFCTSRFHKFAEICRPTHLCLQFANYIDYKALHVRDYRSLPAKVHWFVRQLQIDGGCPVAYVGTGPDHEDIIDRHLDE